MARRRTAGRHGKPCLSVAAGNGNMNLFNAEEKTTMKTPTPVAAIVTSAPSAPIASEQKNSLPVKPVMRMDRRMSQMKEKIKEMQQQMN